MTREEKERIQQKLHRAADAHLNAYGGNLYYEGVARGLEQAAGIVGKTKCVDAVEVVRCGECKHCYVDGENVRYNVCDLNHNKVQADDWFCADAEKREE